MEVKGSCKQDDLSKANITIIWTPIFRWYVIWHGSKNWHKNDICSQEIGQPAQHVLQLDANFKGHLLISSACSFFSSCATN